VPLRICERQLQDGEIAAAWRCFAACSCDSDPWRRVDAGDESPPASAIRLCGRRNGSVAAEWISGGGTVRGPNPCLRVQILHSIPVGESVIAS
jgi:hypothetical protein